MDIRRGTLNTLKGIRRLIRQLLELNGRWAAESKTLIKLFKMLAAWKWSWWRPRLTLWVSFPFKSPVKTWNSRHPDKNLGKRSFKHLNQLTRSLEAVVQEARRKLPKKLRYQFWPIRALKISGLHYCIPKARLRSVCSNSVKKWAAWIVESKSITDKMTRSRKPWKPKNWSN